MTLPRRILHVGQRKTGTTWLQELTENASRAGQIAYQHWDLARALSGLNWKTATGDDLAAAFSCLPAEGDHPAFASCEDLQVHDPLLVAQSVHRLWPEAHLLVTTRAPQDYLMSSFNNDSFRRAQPATDFTGAFLRNHMLRAYDFDGYASAWRSVFGEGNVTFLPYELLCDNADLYLDALNGMFGTDLRPFLPRARLNVSPPPEFLLLERRINARIKRAAPEILETRDWAQFKHIVSFSVGSAQGLREYFADFFAANPVDEADLPSLSDEQSVACAARMGVLRPLEAYQPYLSRYGLTAGDAASTQPKDQSHEQAPRSGQQHHDAKGKRQVRRRNKGDGV